MIKQAKTSSVSEEQKITHENKQTVKPTNRQTKDITREQTERINLFWHEQMTSCKKKQTYKLTKIPYKNRGQVIGTNK